MRALLSIATLLAMAFSAFAQAQDADSIPEPGILGLIGIGVAAVLIARRGKK
jgi:hypothetical protein